MITVELKQVRLFSYHGLYPEEKLTGNEFEINLAVSYLPEEGILTEISSSIDYTALYELLKFQFDTPVDLMETLAIQIAGEIRNAYPQTKRIELSITKLHVPITGFAGQAAVHFRKDY